MNVTAYSQELDAALKDYLPPLSMSAEQVLTQFEVEGLALFKELVSGGVVKLSADETTLTRLRLHLRHSLDVLVTVCQYVNPRDVGLFTKTIARMRALSEDKNNDYSPFNIYKCGNLGLATRLGDKISRITNAVLQGTALKVKDEGLLDTALDAVNYCVYHLMVAKDEWVTEAERVQFCAYLREHGGGELAGMYRPVGGRMVSL